MTATATAPRPTRQRSAVPITPLPQLLQQFEAELSTVFFEREAHTDVILTAMLARQHGYMEGEPGTGKSDLLETICKAITNGKYARFLMDPFMGKEDVFGAHDIARYLAGGGWVRDTTDTAVDAHLVMFDELPRTNEGIMASILTIMNERKFKPNGHWIDVPLLSAWGAANSYIFDVLPALADRFMVTLSVEDLKEESSFEKMYARACEGVRMPLQTVIPLDQLLHACHVEVPAVIIPAGVQDSVRQLRADLAAEQVRLSPRRWANTPSLIKASAYKRGKTVADEDDLAILQHALFQHQDHRALVRSKVLALTSPITKAALELGAQIDDISAEIDKRRKESLPERAAYGAQAQYDLTQIQTKLTAQIEAANREGRNPAVLTEVTKAVKTLRDKIYTDCMNVPADRL